MTQCPSCNHTNPSDARFCQNCGKKLVVICRRCGTENEISTRFCKSCGVNLADAKFGISEQIAENWWNFFSSFSVFREMTSTDGWARKKTYFMAKELLVHSDISNKSLLAERLAFFLPIANKRWCISVLDLDEATIKQGAIWAGTTGLGIFDFDKQQVHFLLYELLNSCSQKGDNIYLGLSENHKISMAIKVSRPSGVLNAIGLVFDLIGILFNTLWAIFGQAPLKSDADRVIEEQRRLQDSDERQRQYNYADSYVNGISTFFSKIISLKNNINSGQTK
jgi:hypothetical protein